LAHCAYAVTPAHPEDPVQPLKLKPEPRYSRSLEYGLVLLKCFSSKRPTWQISELADTLEISRSTTHRYAQTLLALDHLEQDPRRRYRLSHRAARAGMNAIDTLRTETPAARQVLQELRSQTGHTVSMAALRGTHALYLQRLHSHGPGQYAADLEHGVGAHVPLHCTAIGKALLASLSQPEQNATVALLTLEQEGPNTIKTKQALTEQLAHIRADGIATCDEEQAWGVRSIAAAVPQPGRTRPLAISITIPAQHYTTTEINSLYGAHVKTAAERI
jgi:IclR family acetate operon transcriptional repressor